jgi:uncharacterized membrane protein
MTKRSLYPVALILVALIFSAAVYGRLPDELPVHWNWQGEVDRRGSRLEGAFALPGLAVAILALMRVLPRLDPRRANYARFAGTYDVVVNALVTMLVCFHVLVLGSALGWPLPLRRVAPALLGVFLIVVGNVVPRARSNWWFGVRTPWTLSNERVWARSNRVAGYLLICAGIALLVTAGLPSPWTAALAVVAVVVGLLGPVPYSYWIWRKERSS